MIPANFKPSDFFKHLSERLVKEFTDAEIFTTPGLVGGGRENATIRGLKGLLPPGTAIGSGCVIDSRKGTSAQVDLVVYETGIMPVFTYDLSGKESYFPCEAVIAAGEIKSTLDSTGLKDAFQKCVSVKSRVRQTANPCRFRKYGSRQVALGAENTKINPEANPMDSPFFFILCGSLGRSSPALVKQFAALSRSTPEHLRPNVIACLDGKSFAYMNLSNRWVMDSGIGADSVCECIHEDGPLHHLVTQIHKFNTEGRTVAEMSLSSYISGTQKPSFDCGFITKI